MTTQQITTSPGGYEAHDRRKRMWLAAERAKAAHPDLGERLRQDMNRAARFGWTVDAYAPGGVAFGCGNYRK